MILFIFQPSLSRWSNDEALVGRLWGEASGTEVIERSTTSTDLHACSSIPLSLDGLMALQRKGRLLRTRNCPAIATAASFSLSGSDVAALRAVVIQYPRLAYRPSASRAGHRYLTRPCHSKDSGKVMFIAMPWIFAVIRCGLSTHTSRKDRGLNVSFIIFALHRRS